MNDARALDAVLRSLPSLRPMPAAVQQLCRLTESAESDIRQISRLIALDEALTVKILRVVNSAFYGLAEKIENVNRAVIVLGFSQVRSIALSLGVMQMSEDLLADAADEQRQQMWRHAVASAIIARLFARWSGVADAEETFTAGLLHDMGKLVLYAWRPDEYRHLIATVRGQGTDFCAAEQALFGFDHAAAGERLCLFWNIPGQLRDIVGRHHKQVSAEDYLVKSSRMQALSQIGDSMAKMMHVGDSGNPVIETAMLYALSHTASLRRDTRAVIETLPKEFAEVEQAFGISLGGIPKLMNAEHAVVYLADSFQRDCAVCALLGQGYTVSDSEQPDELPAAVRVVITDAPLAEALRRRLQRERVVVAEFPRQDPASAGFVAQGFFLSRFLTWLARATA